MSFIMRFFKELADEETDEITEIMHSLYGPFGEYTLMVPTYRRHKLAMTLILAAIYAPLLIGRFLLVVISCWIERNNLEHFSLALHYALIVSYCLVMLFFTNAYRRRLFANHLVIGRPSGQYRNSSIYEEPEVKEIREQIFREFVQFLILPFGTIGTTCACLWGPYLKHFGTQRLSRNGVNLNLLFPCYYPFSTDKGTTHYIILGLQLLTVIILATAILTSYISFLRQVQSMQFEYRVACYALATVIQRAANSYKQEYPDQVNQNVEPMDPRFQECIRHVMNDIVRHHLNILKLGRGFDDIVTWVTGWALVAGAGSFALSLINVVLSLKAKEYENVLVFTVLGLGEALTLMTVNMIGEAVTKDVSEYLQLIAPSNTTQLRIKMFTVLRFINGWHFVKSLGLVVLPSCNFRDATYFMEWVHLNVANRRILLNLQVGANQPFVFFAGKIMPLNHDTYSSILNSAYSFFNIVLARLEGGS